MSNLCEMSDLPKEQCAMSCCSGPTTGPPQKVAQQPTGFRRGTQSAFQIGGQTLAQITSRCPECGDDIEINDPISKTDRGLWAHEECA